MPVWMILKFKQGGIDWVQDYIYVPVTLPFLHYMSEDFDNHIISLSIASIELVVSPERPNHFGIQLPTVKEKINKLRGEKSTPQFLLGDIHQFVIQICDIEEVWQLIAMSVFCV
ncbi:hypothetical protein ABEW34_13525 [Paenibacillus algorifonticola]|uniref:hypothetical protein n=1 Tax=Paenibacillus algorifonticola TaxID=684063 RepID=UPI003D2C1762